MDTNEMLKLILNELKDVKTELKTVNFRLDTLEAGQQDLKTDIKSIDKRISENAKDTASMFHMQTDYLTAEFKKEFARIEIRIEHELLSKVQSLHEGYQMICEKLSIV